MDNIPADIENEMRIKPLQKMPDFIGRIPEDIAVSEKFNAAEKAVLCAIDKQSQETRWAIWSFGNSINQAREAEFESRLQNRHLKQKTKDAWKAIFAIIIAILGAGATVMFSYMAHAHP